MNHNNKVVWYEGMFLQAQHFQQQDRHTEYLINRKFQSVDNHLWGFEQLELDQELLSLGKIGLKVARGIFPDGSIFNMPSHDALPKPYDVRENNGGAMLYLAIPLRQAGHVEISPPEYNQPVRYHAMNHQSHDIIAESEQHCDIQVGSLACRILSDHDDLSGYSCLAFASIEEVRSNHRITLGKKFIPSCLNIDVSSSLKNLVSEIHGLLNHRGQMLAERLTDSQTTGTAEVVDFVLLQTINRYEPLFHYLIEKSPLHPEDLFKLLLQVMGEMATFTNDVRRPVDIPAYQHDALFETFQPLITAIRHSLSMVLEQNATAIPLESRELGTWVGQINDKALITNCRFILAAYSDLPHEQLRPTLPKQIKISPVEQFAALVKRNLPGVPIHPMPTVPRQIPYHNNFAYFEVDVKHELWGALIKSAGIAIHISTPLPGIKLELWAIRG